MDDRELIKRIMEEVKDEKLREELLALVAEKNRRQSEAKQEEEKPINHKTRHGILFKVGRIIGGIILFIILTFAFFFIFSAFGPLVAFAFLILLAFFMVGWIIGGIILFIILIFVLFIIPIFAFFFIFSAFEPFEPLAAFAFLTLLAFLILLALQRISQLLEKKR